MTHDVNRDVPKLVLTRREAALALGVSEMTIDRFRREGRLKAHYLGRYSPRFKLEDIQRFLSSCADSR